MLYRILSVGLLAGCLAGLATAALQTVTTTPMIITAESYEHSTAARNSSHPYIHQAAYGEARLILAHNSAGTADAGHEQEWAPQDGIERTFYTSITTIITTIGFAFMLLAAMILSNAPINAHAGLAWGMAGFVATGLAPALGLSPELPGAAAAEVVHRQLWWIGTATATAVALWLMLRQSSAAAIVIGLALICAPHIIGAPHPHEYASKVPSELTAHFASASLVVHAVAWALVGAITGYLWQRGQAGVHA